MGLTLRASPWMGSHWAILVLGSSVNCQALHSVNVVKCLNFMHQMLVVFFVTTIFEDRHEIEWKICLGFCVKVNVKLLLFPHVIIGKWHEFKNSDQHRIYMHFLEAWRKGEIKHKPAISHGIAEKSVTK
ncbi:hypothetical protein AMTR_s00032p00079020 [Amborella trichopoda]|uniref:Uncharacterized protein n=1 Tax=Amborella trichopoda TaxID=13333 RepID=U5D360_AMBTC|nr:hypothetical protein AMTR_s00032p00079020 [Amborella trichopoda]